jgi:hypothetical protein
MSTAVEQVPQPRIREVRPRSSPSGVTNVLLLCGIAASVLYVVADVVGAIVWDGYSLKSFTISELSAIDAPSRPLVPSLMLVFGVLVTIATMVLFGVLAAVDGPRIAANEPTPWVGLTERVCVGADLLWMFVLSGALLCTQGGPADQQRYAAGSHVQPGKGVYA